MSLRGLPREKVLATVVHLLETTLIRVGNDEYVKANESYGLTTFKSKACRGRGVGGAVPASSARAASNGRWRCATDGWPGSSGRARSCRDKTSCNISTTTRSCAPSPPATSTPTCREMAGRDITAKDFRTWAGTVLMARFLKASGQFESETKAKRAISAAVKQVVDGLGNTPSVCRKSYIHPAVTGAYLGGGFVLEAVQVGAPPEPKGLRPEEATVLSLLRGS